MTANFDARDLTAEPVAPAPRMMPMAKPARKAGFYRRFVKRAVDVALVTLAAPAVLPVVAVIAFMVKRDGGSAFYTQQRVGLNGRAFRMFKLRSMVVDADARLITYLANNPEAKAEWDSHQKLRNDPRITRFGNFLRRSSLDELPQLWNVFIGDMSLIGPRPMMLDQRALYGGQAYYRLRPGITGAWQVGDRNESTFAQRAEIDEDYDRNLCLTSDLRILWKTFAVVLRGTGV